MSATEQMRAMLDGLMGTARDGTDSQKKHLHFTDPRVCRPFLLDCCPHDTFAFTKLDLGECSKVHDPALRADFLNASKTKEYSYEVTALDRLQAFVNDADRKTEALKRRLAETQEELTAEETSKLDKVHELTEKLGKKLAQLDKATADEDVEAKQKFSEEAEKIKKERAAAEIEYKNVSRPASSHQQQNLRVCDICSAYLGINDNDSRLSDHYGGKLHLGFIEIREKLEDLKRIVAEKRMRKNVNNNGKNSTVAPTNAASSQQSRSSERQQLDRGAGSHKSYDHDRPPRENYRMHDPSPHYNDRARDYDRYREHEFERNRNRYRYRNDHREKDWERERERERDRDRYREKERERSRSDGRYYRDIHPPRDSRSSREPRYRDERSDRIDSRPSWDDREDSRDMMYQRRVKEWEKREQEKSRRNYIRAEEEKARKLLEEQESKKLKEFLEDYNDDRDDVRFYRGSAFARRLAERRKEIEYDEVSNQRERSELEQLSRICKNEDSTPQVIERVEDNSNNNTSTTNDKADSNNIDHCNNTNVTPTSNKTDSTAPNNSVSSKESTSLASVKVPQPVENKKEEVEKLIAKIPTNKEELFAWQLDWSMLDDNLMEKRIRPWVSKKIAFFFDDMGEKESNLIQWICSSLNERLDGHSILNRIALILEDDAEKFVVQMWRLLAFELEAKSRGLRK